jgi:four helix bundle protein
MVRRQRAWTPAPRLSIDPLRAPAPAPQGEPNQNDRHPDSGATNWRALRVKTHKDLEVWQESVALAKNVYDLTRLYPREELFGLTNQMRRAAVSIPSNIAEGAARHGSREFMQFLYTAVGSATEFDTQLEISRAVGLGEPAKLDEVQRLTNKVAQMLYGLIRTTKAKLWSVPIPGPRSPNPGWTTTKISRTSSSTTLKAP